MLLTIEDNIPGTLIRRFLPIAPRNPVARRESDKRGGLTGKTVGFEWDWLPAGSAPRYNSPAAAQALLLQPPQKTSMRKQLRMRKRRGNAVGSQPPVGLD